jgi:hypothetical protein
MLRGDDVARRASGMTGHDGRPMQWLPDAVERPGLPHAAPMV